MADLGITGIGDATLIASGGSALVYRAMTDGGAEVAVKVLRGIRGAEVARRFEREQQAALRLHEHPNIIDVHRSGVNASGEPYLIMPLMQRGSLADELEREGAFAVDAAVTDVAAACEAIDFAHRRGVLHRDLKPGNLLRADDGSIVVTDFGIARVVDAGITSATINATTPLYAAPELLGAGEASVQSDVYSLAALLFALLNGEPAFADAGNIWATINRLRTEPVPSIPGVPAPVMRVVEQAMAKEPADRPGTVGQLHLNLIAALDAGPDWYPPSTAAVTIDAAAAPPMVEAVPAPPMVPVVLAPEPAPGPEPVPLPPRHETGGGGGATGDVDDRGGGPVPVRRSPGAMAKALAALGALLLVAAVGWIAIDRALGSDERPANTAQPVDESLPAPTSVAAPDTTADADTTPAPDLAGSDATPTESDTDADADIELVSFAGDHFRAHFPKGWSVVTSDVDVGYGYRSEFAAPEMYLNIDTTPADRRDGRVSIAESARQIAASISTASIIEVEETDDRTLYSFTFRNDRGVESIDIFFEVDGDGYAVVAGSNTQTEAVFGIARQVALNVRSNP